MWTDEFDVMTDNSCIFLLRGCLFVCLLSSNQELVKRNCQPRGWVFPIKLFLSWRWRASLGSEDWRRNCNLNTLLMNIKCTNNRKLNKMTSGNIFRLLTAIISFLISLLFGVRSPQPGQQGGCVIKRLKANFVRMTRTRLDYSHPWQQFTPRRIGRREKQASAQT